MAPYAAIAKERRIHSVDGRFAVVIFDSIKPEAGTIELSMDQA